MGRSFWLIIYQQVFPFASLAWRELLETTSKIADGKSDFYPAGMWSRPLMPASVVDAQALLLPGRHHTIHRCPSGWALAVYW